MRDGKLAWLFLDMNAYFASVEQQVRPELRGRPTAVAPVMAESTCCIAASYEAKKYGIKTGTKISVARKLCPELEVVEARPGLYVQYHKEIVEAVNMVLPVENIHSVDEMSCRLTASQCNKDNALVLAQRTKRAIREHVGEYLRCSIGIAPNRFLAKIASNINKPDSLTVINSEDIPQKLYSLSLLDLPGIGNGMLARLNCHGVHTVEQLCSLSKSQLYGIWKSVVGKRWWHLLRGDDLAEFTAQRRTVSHSHVLHPDMRTDSRMYAVFMKLIHKAGARLRRLNYFTGCITFHISYFDRQKSWKSSVVIGRCQDTLTMIRAFSKVWSSRPAYRKPLHISVTLSDLTHCSQTTLPLFTDEHKMTKLAQTIDRINERYGLDCVYFGTMHDARESAPMRISFTSIPDLIAESTASDRALSKIQ
jgi:DNA polymerase IV